MSKATKNKIFGILRCNWELSLIKFGSTQNDALPWVYHAQKHRPKDSHISCLGISIRYFTTFTQ
jgi:hypothetical protein